MCRIKTASQTQLTGLTKQVVTLASSLTNVSDVRVGKPVRYRGVSKVKLPLRWPRDLIEVIVCDNEYGRRKVNVLTDKPGAIQRILRDRLCKVSIVCEQGVGT